MRVGVDGRSLVGGQGRGVAHYTSALLEALVAAHPQDEWRVVLPRGPVSGLPRGVVPVRHALPGRLLHGPAAVLGRPRLDVLAGGCDVVWMPAPAPAAITPGTPLVLSVHDRSWERRPGDFTPYERAWHGLARPRALARGARFVLTPTAAGNADLVGAWGLDPARVRTIPLAPAVTAPAAASAGGEPYFLFAGALEPRKAPAVLARAYALARDRGLTASLVVAGNGRLAGEVIGPGISLLGHVGDDRLPALYAGALALVFPSLDEGFGLPPVEALGYGTPVIAADLPVLRETLGPHGARYVPPGDAAALAHALVELAGDPHERDRLAAAGQAAVAGLDWRRTAAATRAALSEAAG